MHIAKVYTHTHPHPHPPPTHTGTQCNMGIIIVTLEEHNDNKKSPTQMYVPLQRHFLSFLF